jgi:hypothetical protein
MVDHSSEVSARTVGDQVALGTRVALYRALADDGTDVTASLNGGGAEPFLGRSGQAVTVVLAADGPAQGPLILDAERKGAAGDPDAMGILVQVPDGPGWETVGHCFPRRSFDEIGVNCGDANEVRLTFLSDVRVRFVGRLVSTDEVPSVQWATLEAARDTRLGDVTAEVETADSLAAVMTGPDSLNLGFVVSPVAEGLVRECFLSVGATLVSAREVSQGRLRQLEALPTQWALEQSRPNPSSSSATIRFALPQARHVRLEVFDVQGRRVRKLAEGSFAAGYHAVDWNRQDDGGNLVKAGVYLYRIEAGSFRDQKKMVLLP